MQSNLKFYMVRTYIACEHLNKSQHISRRVISFKANVLVYLQLTKSYCNGHLLVSYIVENPTRIYSTISYCDRLDQLVRGVQLIIDLMN